MLAVAAGVLLSKPLAIVLAVLATAVLALVIAGTQVVQRRFPDLGRLPLVNDHRFYERLRERAGATEPEPPAIPRGVFHVSALPFVDVLRFALKQGEAIAVRLNDVVPDPAAIAAAIEWHDKLYKTLTHERPDLARRLLDETDVVVAIPTIDLSSINPAHHVVVGQAAWLKGIIEQMNPTPLERWLEGRIDAAAVIARERSGSAYLKAMHEWDVKNVNDLRNEWPERVRAYLAHPQDPPHWDGPPSPYTSEGDAAYFERRLDWMTVALDGERKVTNQ